MRKLVLIGGLVCLCATVALAQGKIASEWKCAKPAMMHALEVGDQPGHAYAIDQVKCTAVKGEMAGAKEKEGTGTEFADVNGDKSSGHGLFVETLASGDKAHITYQFTATTKNGQFQSGSNKWQISGGTGKLKGAKGSGSCTAKGNPDGSSNFTCNGTYTLSK